LLPEAPSDPALRRLTVDGAPVVYTSEGRGDCVVLGIHGCPGSVRDFRWMGPCLAPDVRFIRLDLPGFGRTPLSTFRDPTFTARAAWLTRVMDELEIDRVTAVGHSAGGPLALQLAASHPDRVKALGLVAAPGVTPHRAVRKYARRKLWSRALRVPVLMQILGVPLRRGFERSGFPKGLPAYTLRQSIHIVAQFDFEATRRNLAAAQCPTLVAWAEDDRFIERGISEELAELAPNGPRLTFATGGHYVQKHGAVEIAAALVEMATA
jgi:pimeloyl-ACP methyl ester carboxylesterase